MPKVYKGTKYEDCLPIGSMDIVDHFPYQDLRDYYQKWYRPDLQAIIVVGDIDVDKDDKPNATMKISYNADPSRYNELNPIVYQQLKNIADNGPAASSMQKVKEYLIKQYAQAAITNDYWSYIIWHELDDDTDFDRDYCKMVSDMTAANVQRIAQQLLAAKRCIEVTMLSE